MRVGSQSAFECCVADIWCNMLRRVALAVLGIAVLLQVAVAGEPSQDGGLLREKWLVSESLTERDTATTLYAYSTFLKCTTDLRFTASSTEEVSEIVKRHTASSNKPVKIRATRPNFHSAVGFVCAGTGGSTKLESDADKKLKSKTPGIDDGGAGTAITVLLHLMNRVVSVDAERYRMTVEAGMTIQGLVDAAEAHGMSILAGSLSVYGNLTVGGVIAASAHGSGLSLMHLVRKLKWVNARGDVVVSDAETEEGAKEVSAQLGGLGLLGIITEITLQLEPPSMTVVEVRDDLDDANMVEELKRIREVETPYITPYWRPELGTFRVVLFTHVRPGESLPTTSPAFDPNGICVDLPAFSDEALRHLREVTSAWTDDFTGEMDSHSCSMAEAISRSPFIKNGDGQIVKHATLNTNRAALGAECAPSCLFEIGKGMAIESGEFAIKVSQFEDWVQDVKAVARAELGEVEARLQKRLGRDDVKSCLPGQFVLRFNRGVSTLISTNAGTEDVVFVQWVPLQSSLTPRKAGRHASFYETIEQLTLCKYGGRPAYGQNSERVFRHPKCPVRDNFPAENFDQMLALQLLHDPNKIFEPTLFSHVVHRRGPEYGDLCSLQLWCYCEQDSHCPESHSCQASPVFPEYKICKLIADSETKHHDEL